MLYNIFDLNKVDIPKEGISCTVKGYFSYQLSDANSNSLQPHCYISEAPEDSSSFIAMSDNIGETIISDDETFGMLVGGSYAYYGIHALVEGVIERNGDNLIFSKVKSLTLEKNDLSQRFIFN